MKSNLAIVFNLASALCGFTGVILSLIANGPSCLAMYTDEVALFAGVVSIILAVRLLRKDPWRTGCSTQRRPSLTANTSATANSQTGNAHQSTLPFFRYASTVMQIVLIIAALVSFLPTFHFPFNVTSPHLILMHFAAPGLSVISFFALEPRTDLRLRDALLSMVYTFIYAAVAIGITASGLYHSKAYPFLDFHPGHIAAPVLEDLAILLAIYVIALLVLHIRRQKNPDTSRTSQA